MFLEYIKRNYIFEKVIPTGDKHKEYSLNHSLCRKKTLLHERTDAESDGGTKENYNYENKSKSH